MLTKTSKSSSNFLDAKLVDKSLNKNISTNDDVYMRAYNGGKRYYIPTYMMCLNGNKSLHEIHSLISYIDQHSLMVHIRKNIVSIYKYHKDGNAEGGFIEFIKEYNPLKIYIGKSYKLNTSNKSTKSYIHDPQYDGITILLKITKNKYIYIGESIYEFSVTGDEILEYYSIVADNASVWNVAIGKKNIYYMLYKEYLPIDKFKQTMNISKITKDIKYELYNYYEQYKNHHKNKYTFYHKNKGKSHIMNFKLLKTF